MSHALAEEHLAAQPPRMAVMPGSAVGAGARRVLGRVIFYGLLCLIMLAAVPYGTVEGWWKAIFECLVCLLGILWSIECALSGERPVREYAMLLPLLALILFAIVQAAPLRSIEMAGNTGSFRRALSSDAYETRLFIFYLLTLATVLVMLLRYTSNERRLRVLLDALVAIGTGSALFGLARQWTQRSTGFFLPHLEPGVGYGQFINHNHFAFLMEMVLGLVLGLLIGRGVGRKRMLFYLAATIPMVLGIIFSGSRGGLTTMLCQILFLAILFGMVQPARNSREVEGRMPGWLWRMSRLLAVRVVLIASLMVLVTLSVLWIGGDTLMTRLESARSEFGAKESDRYTKTLRPKIWRATWLLIKEHPLAGVGFGGYWAAIPRYHEASGEFTPQQAHNDYLELLASGGLIGVATGVWFVVALIRKARTRLRTAPPAGRAACVGALVGIFGVAIHSIVDFGLHITINNLVFIVLVVIATLHGQEASQRVSGRGLAS